MPSGIYIRKIKPILPKFEKKIEMIPECGCWIWMGTLALNGYGRLWMNKKRQSAHRASWKIYNGSIPNGMGILHRCDTKSCVNPHHLFLGTNKDNTQDAVKKNRQLKGESHGCAKLSEQEVKEIRKDNHTLRTIAIDYSISRRQILRIKQGKSWRHI